MPWQWANTPGRGQQIGAVDVDDSTKACAKCGDETVLTRDHVIPLTKGGSDDIENIQPLCLPCNSSKGTDTMDYRPEAGRTY